MIENLVVALIVTLAALHACAKYLPAGLRSRIVLALARAGLAQPWISRWFGAQSGCGTGDAGCKSCADRCADPQAPSGGDAPGAPSAMLSAPAGNKHPVIRLHARPTGS
ncbi:DUF6587 family protein [Massilia glaciei]|uniref:Uncharacterized protein n=1 Tax=Massilia glaciei TaxID=1524097 RepID=A0A2U2HHB1_9BURK|nr:DUF6587 family protein [Massilia glaciei]PWF45043.1 hypothetical protein C7C56_018745 [Massilia glaciei]